MEQKAIHQCKGGVTATGELNLTVSSLKRDAQMYERQSCDDVRPIGAIARQDGSAGSSGLRC